MENSNGVPCIANFNQLCSLLKREKQRILQTFR